ASTGLSSGSNAAGRPPLERSGRAEKAVSGASSTSVFHCEQSAHCPCQREVTLPHSVQTYRRLGLAMGGDYAERMGNTSGKVIASGRSTPSTHCGHSTLGYFGRPMNVESLLLTIEGSVAIGAAIGL